MIDVGGPSMLRSAAKNFAFVIAVCKPEQYEVVLDELRTRGSVSLELRRSLANEAFGLTASYDATIANWFGETEEFPEQLTLAFQKVVDLPYGENPHQRAAYYREIGARRHLLSNVDQLGGQGALVQQPCRSRRRSPRGQAVLRADGGARQARQPVRRRERRDDRGGIRARARRRSGLGVRLRDDPQPAGVGCARRADRRAVRRGDSGTGVRRGRTRSAPREGGAPDSSGTRAAVGHARRARLTSACSAACSCRSATPSSAGPTRCRHRSAHRPRSSSRISLFAWQVCRHVTSNAIVIAKDRQTIGIGAGQMSRVDAVKIALEKAREHGHDVTGSVLASDAFFPFADGPQLALDGGRRRDRPAGRLEARRRSRRCGRGGRRVDGLHRATAFPALGAVYGAVSGHAGEARMSVCPGSRERLEQFAHKRS